MQLHTIVRKHPNEQKAVRVGRGGKRGTTSGGGQKGQRSRSGHRIRPAVRDLIQRLPKLRGYQNKAKSDRPIELTLTDLATITGIVSKESLLKAGLISSKHDTVKVLATGRLTKALVVEGIRLSAGAKTKIEKAGGAVK